MYSELLNIEKPTHLEIQDAQQVSLFLDNMIF